MPKFDMSQTKRCLLTNTNKETESNHMSKKRKKEPRKMHPTRTFIMAKRSQTITCGIQTKPIRYTLSHTMPSLSYYLP